MLSVQYLYNREYRIVVKSGVHKYKSYIGIEVSTFHKTIVIVFLISSEIVEEFNVPPNNIQMLAITIFAVIKRLYVVHKYV